jgi:hypothetical protein
MRNWLFAVVSLLVTAGLLCGCIFIEPGWYGHRHHHHYNDRY